MYMDLIEKYQDQIVLEIGGHDHWQDVRYYKSPGGKQMYRNLLVATGVSPDHGQMPGFNTFKVEDQQVVHLVETSLDLPKTYDMETPISLDDLTTYEMDYSKILPDLSVDSIDKFYEESILDDFLKFISDKNGFPSSDPEMYEQGLDLGASWGLVSPSHDNVNLFIC